MKMIKQNLSYISKSLLNNTHKEQAVIINVMLEETIQEVKETTFVYEVPFCSVKEDYHIPIYVNRSKKAKFSILCDLQELQAELNKKTTNVKRCLALVQKMLNNNLYQDSINKTINKWVNVGKIETKIRKLKVQ